MCNKHAKFQYLPSDEQVVEIIYVFIAELVLLYKNKIICKKFRRHSLISIRQTTYGSVCMSKFNKPLAICLVQKA
jgi:hypothetical protein